MLGISKLVDAIFQHAASVNNHREAVNANTHRLNGISERVEALANSVESLSGNTALLSNGVDAMSGVLVNLTDAVDRAAEAIEDPAPVYTYRTTLKLPDTNVTITILGGIPMADQEPVIVGIERNQEFDGSTRLFDRHGDEVTPSNPRIEFTGVATVGLGFVMTGLNDYTIQTDPNADFGNSLVEFVADGDPGEAEQEIRVPVCALSVTQNKATTGSSTVGEVRDRREPDETPTEPEPEPTPESEV